MTTTCVYVVRDASGEYVSVRDDGSVRRVPASDQATEFETRDEAQQYVERATDRVLEREVE